MDICGVCIRDVRTSGAVGAAEGVTLGYDASFDIGDMLFGNCDGSTHWRMVAISINVFTVVSLYVRDRAGDFGDCNIAMMLDVSWRKKFRW